MQVKKALLLSMCVAAAFSPAMAEFKAPTIYSEASFHQISADGRYALSEIYGIVALFDLTTGDVTTFGEDDENPQYSLGQGNSITADGSIFLGSTRETNAAYFENGEWHELSVPDSEFSNMSCGITPDGARICGSVGLNPISLDDKIMMIPAYWDRKEDGTYGDAVILPYPTRDLFNEVPQYLTAICISDDGKTIVGQMRFGNGFMTIPIVYQSDEDGKWSYSLPTKDYFNPDKLEAVENPGEFTKMGPNYEDYMTEEELEAYNAAVEDYYNEGDYSKPYPSFTDYMSAEKKAEYTAVKEAYDTEYDEWDEKFTAYQDYLFGVIDASPNFIFNNTFISTDGKQIVSTIEKEVPNDDPLSWAPFKSINTPVVVDIEKGELKVIDTELSLAVSGVANDGIILAHNGMYSQPMLGYVIKDDKVITLYDYLKNINSEFGSWIDKNLTFEVVTGFDDETWDEIYEEMTFTGMPIATPDMSIIASWFNDSNYNVEGVVFDVKANTGIATVKPAGAEMTYANGALVVPAGYASVHVYNITGACVLSAAAPHGVVELPLSAGVYIAKGIRADGSETIVKFCK